MSVRVKDQKETDIWYLVAIRELCAEAAAMMEKRKKDRFYNAFAPYILQSTMELYRTAQIANSIYISKTTPEQDYLNRRYHFQMAIGILNDYEANMALFVETCVVQKTFNEEKAYKFMESNGLKIAKIRIAITRILKKDIEVYRKRNKERIINDVSVAMNYQKDWLSKLEASKTKEAQSQENQTNKDTILNKEESTNSRPNAVKPIIFFD